MEPTKKNPVINKLLSEIAGVDREETIKGNKCVPPPIGCGWVITGFRDDLSAKEYAISGLCQECQDKIFGETIHGKYT